MSPPDEIAPLETQKQHLRALMRRARQSAPADAGPALAANLLRAALIPRSVVIAAFHPVPGEIDTIPTIAALIGQGHTVLLPRTPPRGEPLTFHPWRPGEPLTPGRHNTSHPNTPAETPIVILVPLLAFDASCNRLGYGAGYYDRTIAAFPNVQTIGCAFALQQVDAVPVMPHDVPLDAVVTEAAIHIRPLP